MEKFFVFLIIGVTISAVYAISATGLVVTYITSGVFNFAHGAIGMFLAFVYWELRVNQGWPTPLALARDAARDRAGDRRRCSTCS